MRLCRVAVGSVGQAFADQLGGLVEWEAVLTFYFRLSVRCYFGKWTGQSEWARQKKLLEIAFHHAFPTLESGRIHHMLCSL